MRLLIHAVWVLAVLVSPSLSAAADEKPTEALASLKKEQETALKELESRRKPGTTEAEQKKALYRYYETVAAPWPSSRDVLMRPTPWRP